MGHRVGARLTRWCGASDAVVLGIDNRTGRAADMPGAPAWLRRCGFETQSGAVHARAAGVSVRVKAAEINRYAAQLPVDIKAELVACRKASSENARCRR